MQVKFWKNIIRWMDHYTCSLCPISIEFPWDPGILILTQTFSILSLKFLENYLKLFSLFFFDFSSCYFKFYYTSFMFGTIIIFNNKWISILIICQIFKNKIWNELGKYHSCGCISKVKWVVWPQNANKWIESDWKVKGHFVLCTVVKKIYCELLIVLKQKVKSDQTIVKCLFYNQLLLRCNRNTFK